MKKTGLKTTREFSISSWAVDNRTTVMLLSLIILIGGIASYSSMPKEAMPEVKMPTIYVSTPYPGNSPENIEKLITRPLEKEINSISGIKKLSSSSVQDFSAVIVEFQAEEDVDEALQEVKDAIDKAKSELPSDLDTDPAAAEIDLGEAPIMNINLYGNHTPNELKEYGEDIKDMLEDLGEISEVKIRGVEEKEVAVNIDFHKLTSLNLNFNDIANAINGRNMVMSAGTVKENGREVSIKIDGEFREVAEIEDIVVKYEKQKVVYLKNVLAEPVKLEEKEKESYARFNGQNVVMLDVIKESGQNLIAASDKIEKLIEEVKEKHIVPTDVEIEITLDMSDQTRSQVKNLENSIYSGVILVVGVLLFFLGTRNSLFVGIAIPMSMMLSFIILSALGITINMMVLFGLIMALGMLVDNGIVVVENVYRLMDEGYSPIQAAKEGVGEIAWPIISSTATTLAAFIPLAFWPGIMGEFMQYLPITLIIVLGSSLFVALVVNSALTSMLMKVGADDELDPKKVWKWAGIFFGVGVVISLAGAVGAGNFIAFIGVLLIINLYLLAPAGNWFQNKVLPKLENAYENTLTFALKGKRPIVIFVSTIALMIFSIQIYFAFEPDVLFFPDNEPRYVNVFVEMPLGTKIETTNEVAAHLEEQVAEIIAPYRDKDSIVNSFIVQVGKGTSDPGDPFAGGGTNATPHKARLSVEFVEYADRWSDELGDYINTQDVMNRIRKELDWSKYPDAVITIEKDASGPPAGKPINIEVVGEEYEVLITQVEKIKRIINESDVQGIEELKSDLEIGKPEMIVQIDRAKASRFGVSTSDIAQTIRTALFGREVSKFKDGEDDYPIELRIAEDSRRDFTALMNMNVTFRDQATGKIKKIPINSVAHLEPSYAFGSIRRKDMDRVITIYSNVVDGFNATDINNSLKDILESHQMPDGYSFKFTGEQEEQEKNMAFLSQALLIAVFSILLIIVGQFNRISAPAIIGMSVILSTIGVFLGLVIFEMEFVIIMMMIGIISLAGIVVNNAIVLADYTILTMNRRKEELGSDKRLGKKDLVDSIIKSGKTRLRPVLLTAITTVLGLIPLAIGLNIDFNGLFTSFSPDFSIGSENTIFWGPMCYTIIFGITFATFLTLVVVPVMFLGMERLKYHIYKRKEGLIDDQKEEPVIVVKE